MRNKILIKIWGDNMNEKMNNNSSDNFTSCTGNNTAEELGKKFNQENINHSNENRIDDDRNNQVNGDFNGNVNSKGNFEFNNQVNNQANNIFNNNENKQKQNYNNHNNYNNSNPYNNNQNNYYNSNPYNNNQNPYNNANYYGNIPNGGYPQGAYNPNMNVNNINQQGNMPNFSPFTNTPIRRIFDHFDKVFALAALLIGYLFIQATFLSGWYLGVGTSLMFLTGHIAGYLYVKKRNLQLSKIHKITSVIILLLSISFTYYSNPMAVTANFFFLLFANAYWIYSCGEKPTYRKGYVKELCESIFVYPLSNFGAIFSCLFGKNKSNKSGNGKWILLGLCIAVPIVAIVSTLLMGDELFKAMFSVIFDEFFIKIVEHLWYVVVGLPVALLVFSLWYTKHYNSNINENSNIQQNTAQKTDYRIAPPALMYAIVIPLCVVYFLYLISQVSYFISFIADNLLPEGFTIVDYARNGFFELCVVSVINLIIIFLLILLTKQPQDKTVNGVKIITIVMSAFTIIMIITALYKMFTYIGEYGYTAMRINTSAFMLFLLIIFGLIIAKQLKNNIKLFPTIVTVLIIFICGYTIADTDSFIASENIRRYQLGEINWMGNNLVRKLDDSAYKHIIPFVADKNNGLTDEQNRNLVKIINDRYCDYEDYPLAFNINRFVIYNMIDEYGFGKAYDKYSYYKNENNSEYSSSDYNYNYDYSNETA